MPKTAQEVVDRTRELLQLFGDAEAYYDGFGAAPADGGTSILTGVNEFLSTLTPTRVRTEEFTTATLVGVMSYDLDSSANKVLTVAYNGVEIRETTRVSVASRYPDYRTQLGNPREWFREGNRLYLFPLPGDTESLIYTATVPVPPLTADSDVVEYVPDGLQDFIAYGAAVILAVIDAENPSHERRMGELKEKTKFLIESLADLNTQDLANAMSLDTWVEKPTTNRSGLDG